MTYSRYNKWRTPMSKKLRIITPQEYEIKLKNKAFKRRVKSFFIKSKDISINRVACRRFRHLKRVILSQDEDNE